MGRSYLKRIAGGFTFALLSLVSGQAAAQFHPSLATNAQQAASATDALACDDFSRAVDHYASTRTRVQSEVPPLRVTSNVAEIRDRSNALAFAIQRARGNARQGEFFDSRCGGAIRQRLAQALDGVDVPEFLEALKDEPADRRAPQIHMRYPVAASMATMPANLLNVLPELPPIVEYRFIGRTLVLRDVDAALILDYFVEAVPATARRANGPR
jgi:hypothetical protein